MKDPVKRLMEHKEQIQFALWELQHQRDERSNTKAGDALDVTLQNDEERWDSWDAWGNMAQ